MEQKCFSGYGTIQNLEKILEGENSKNIFLVTGKKSFESCGAKILFDNLSTKYNFKRFYDFSPNPQKTEIGFGLELFKHHNYDTIIAVGGGEVLLTLPKKSNYLPLILLEGYL